MDAKTTTKEALAGKLSAGAGAVRALIGFDGFIDEIINIVDKREDAEHYTRIQTIKTYCDRLMGASGLSCNIEIIPVAEKLGGNGPIFANALKKQNMEITYIGSVGDGTVHPIFDELSRGVCMIPLASPGLTSAYEFNDGKIIISKIEHFKEVTWQKILDTVGLADFVRLLDGSKLIGFENWTMIPHMSDIWQNVLARAVPLMKTPPQEKTLFFDLADPEKRKTGDIKKALGLIGDFTRAGFKTVLGLNKKEACELFEIYFEKIPDYHVAPLKEVAEAVNGKLCVTCLVVHPVDSACCIYEDQYFSTEGPYCSSPALTTGAGDNFNAGFITGWMNGFNMQENLLCGVASSGFYVRKAKSPSTSELAEFLLNWEKGRI